MALFETRFAVSFGDCDPAGIVFYPNFFGWLDRTFHAYLHDRAGGHTGLCAELGARGLGLVDARASFLRPVGEGVELAVRLLSIDWQPRTYTLSYAGFVGDTQMFEGSETRAVFVEEDGRMRAGDTSPLRDRLGG